MRTVSSRLTLLLAIVVLALAGCGGDAAPQDAAEPSAETTQFASAAERAVRAVADEDAVLLDVRTDEEFAAGHAPGAVHLPLARIEAGERPDVAKDRAIYVYCRTGRRAAVALEILREDGFRDLTNIGGLGDWERAGGDVER